MPCPQHFHIHDFNEVNLFKTARVLNIFSFLTRVSISMLLFPFPHLHHRARKVFHTYMLPLSSPMSPGSCALLSNQTA